MPVDTSELGTLLVSRFSHLERLDTEKHAAWLGVHRPTGRRAVIKVAIVGGNHAPSLRREIAALDELNGVEGVVGVLDSALDDDGLIWLATEHSGDSILRAWRAQPQPPERALRLALFLGRTLLSVHAKALVHNDVACNNVVVRTQDGEDTFTLIDFDVCYEEHGATKGVKGSSMRGHYRTPPERFTGGIDLPKIDVWYVGLMVGDILRIWPDSPGPPTVDPNVPWHESFRECILAAAKADVEARLTMLELVQALEAVDQVRVHGVEPPSDNQDRDGGAVVGTLVAPEGAPAGVRRPTVQRGAWLGWGIGIVSIAALATVVGLARLNLDSADVPVAKRGSKPLLLSDDTAVVDAVDRTRSLSEAVALSTDEADPEVSLRVGRPMDRDADEAVVGPSTVAASSGTVATLESRHAAVEESALERGSIAGVDPFPADAPRSVQSTPPPNVTLTVTDGAMDVVLSCDGLSTRLAFTEPGSRAVRAEDGCTVHGTWDGEHGTETTTPLSLALNGVPKVVRCNPIYGRCSEYLP